MTQKTGGNRITLQSIADITGYSKNTVSLALRNSDRLPKDTKTIIKKKAAQLGYKPNLIARNLTTGRSGLVGIYTQALYDSVRTEIVNNLVTELRSSQYCPILGLGQKHSGPWHTSPWATTLRLLNVDAMVIVCEYIERMPIWLKNIPTVMLGCQPRKSLKCDYIALDRNEAAKIATDYLHKKGHHNILMCTEKLSHFGTACHKELTKKNITSFWPNHKFPIDAKHLQMLLRYIMKNKNKFTAALFGDSPLAAEFTTLLLENNVMVPEDISIISYDYLPYARHLKIPLTTIRQPIENLASEAIKIIKKRLDDPESSYIHKTLKHKLIPRNSC